ncbi:MAG TPA: hypothetical protein VLB72_01420 [Burkholderiales bacterium]|nr:hypothetical protein [Burkholderiales bacterium]
MSRSRAKKTDPKLWQKVKAEVTEADKGGRPGQWSARKAQLATREYQERGGGYLGEQRADNSLKQWTEEDWGTASGRRSIETAERYLPKRAREALSDEEYRETTAKKRSDTRRGKQHSRQPEKIAEKTAKHRSRGQSGGRERQIKIL